MNTDHSTNPSALPQNSWLVVCALVLAVSLFLSINFMAVQVIHVDETTQLSGASIPPVEMLRWLAGENPDRFGVPSDRTPPLFYLLHQVWTPLFGSGIVGYRVVSLVSAFTGLLFFASIVRSVSPGIWGLAVLAILSLSMNYIQYSVVIRPYPLFFALACAGCYAVMRYCEVRGTARETRWLVVVTTIGIAATYTHFYGLIMFCATQAALALLALRERRSIWPNVMAVTISALFSSALYPIFVASLDVNTTIPHARVSEFPKLIYRMVASRAAAVYAPVQVGLLAGIACAVLMSIVQLFHATRRKSLRLDNESAFRFVVFMVSCLGLVVSLVAAAVVKGFNVLEPHYHVWLLPFVYTLVLLPKTGFSKLHAASIAMALVTTSAAAFIFFRNMHVFVSSPSGALQSIINRLPEGTPVVYDNAFESSWYFGSYPIRFIYQGRVRQFLVDSAKPEMGFRVAEANKLFFAPKLEIATEMEVIGLSEYMIYARTAHMFVGQATRLIRYGEPSIPDNREDENFAARYGYEVTESGYYPSYTAIRISVLKRKL